MEILKCPVCDKGLAKRESRWQCANNHQFDIAKQGHVNLLMSQTAKSKQHGDEKMMVLARQNYLDKGYYGVFKAKLESLVKDFNPKVILDLGCGEGYYAQDLSSIYDVYGVDISKDAIMKAAKRNSNMTCVVASTYAIPVLSSSVDVAYCVFAPFSIAEVSRVLNEGGVFIEVFPLERHLFELKGVLYEKPYKNEEVIHDYEGFERVSSHRVEDTIDLKTNTDIYNLFTMTPYYHRTPERGIKALHALQSLQTEIGFGFAVYRKL